MSTPVIDEESESKSTGTLTAIRGSSSFSKASRSQGVKIDKYFALTIFIASLIALIVYKTGLYNSKRITLSDTEKQSSLNDPSQRPITAKISQIDTINNDRSIDIGNQPLPLRSDKISSGLGQNISLSDKNESNDMKATDSMNEIRTTTKTSELKEDTIKEGPPTESDWNPQTMISEDEFEPSELKPSLKNPTPHAKPTEIAVIGSSRTPSRAPLIRNRSKAPIQMSNFRPQNGITIVEAPRKRQTPFPVPPPPTRVVGSSHSHVEVAIVDYPEQPVEPYGRDGSSDSTRNRCGEALQGNINRPCENDDAYCGDWRSETRFFHANGCKYQDITTNQARKCLGSRTLAFVGDSQIRDIAVGVAYFLMGETLDSADDERFEVNHFYDTNGTKIPDFSTWPADSSNKEGNGFVYPQERFRHAHNINWQVQYWAVYRRKTIQEQGHDIITNSMQKSWSTLRPIDLSFWVHGIHDYGWYNTPPYGELFYQRIFQPWMSLKKNSSVPSVWVSLNPQCADKMKGVRGMKAGLHDIVDAVNKYMNQRLLKEKIPYWDAGAVLRSPHRCELTADGIHVKMYVDIMRAKMLFNHLCDENMNWRGSEAAFT